MFSGLLKKEKFDLISEPTKISIGRAVYSLRGNNGIDVCSFYFQNSLYCCGERRIGHFYYAYSDFDKNGNILERFSNERTLENIDRLYQFYLTKTNQIGDFSFPFVRCNLNESYPLWTEYLTSKAGFTVMGRWKNSYDGFNGNIITELAKIRYPK